MFKGVTRSFRACSSSASNTSMRAGNEDKLPRGARKAYWSTFFSSKPKGPAGTPVLKTSSKAH